MIFDRNLPLTLCLLASPFLSVQGKRLSKGCQNQDIESPFSDNGPLDTFKFTVMNDETQNRRHELTFPKNYDPSTPAPLLMHFHGYGNPGECGERCSKEAPKKGFITLEMVGYGRSFLMALTGFFILFFSFFFPCDEITRPPWPSVLEVSWDNL